jgi:hypothetical protein
MMNYQREMESLLMKNESEGGMAMMSEKIGVVFIITSLLLCVCSPAFSFSICYQGSKGLTESNTAFNQYFDSSLKNHKSEPEFVRVCDVSRTQNNKGYFVVLDCGNNVLLKVSSASEFLKGLKTGQEVVFYGEAQEWEKSLSQGSKKDYVEIKINNGFVNFQELDRAPAEGQ